jgi:hypothetical protein
MRSTSCESARVEENLPNTSSRDCNRWRPVWINAGISSVSAAPEAMLDSIPMKQPPATSTPSSTIGNKKSYSLLGAPS